MRPLRCASAQRVIATTRRHRESTSIQHYYGNMNQRTPVNKRCNAIVLRTNGSCAPCDRTHKIAVARCAPCRGGGLARISSSHNQMEESPRGSFHEAVNDPGDTSSNGPRAYLTMQMIARLRAQCGRVSTRLAQLFIILFKILPLA